MQLRLICTSSRTRERLAAPERLADCTFGAVARFTAWLARGPYIHPRRATLIRERPPRGAGPRGRMLEKLYA